MTCATVKGVCKFGACEPQCGLEFDIENDPIVRVDAIRVETLNCLLPPLPWMLATESAC